MQQRPVKCCHPNCQDCPYVDCRWDGYSSKDDAVTDAIEKELSIDEMPFEKRHSKEIYDRYNHSEHGKQVRSKYGTSEAYKESQQKYRRSAKGKEANRKRSIKYYQKKSREQGRPLSTVKDHVKKYGVDMGKGEFIATISTNSRLTLPKKFCEQLGFNRGDKVAVYVDRQGKLVIIGIDKARKLSERS